MTTPESSAAEHTRVVALSVDLMDRSKISAAFSDVILVRSVAKLFEEATFDALVLVDLTRLDEVAVLADIDGRVITYGSHVNEDLLAEASSAGVESLPRSVFFRRLEMGQF